MSTQELLRLGGVGILNEKDLSELSASTRRVHTLMRDGRWHTADEIEHAAGENGVPAREGLRRMRELRAAGWEIERERCGERREFKYRLKVKMKGLPSIWRD